MRKTFAVLVVTAVLLGVVGTAFAESGPIYPFAKTSRVKVLENKIIWPF